MQLKDASLWMLLVLAARDLRLRAVGYVYYTLFQTSDVYVLYIFILYSLKFILC